MARRKPLMVNKVIAVLLMVMKVVVRNNGCADSISKEAQICGTFTA